MADVPAPLPHPATTPAPKSRKPPARAGAGAGAIKRNQVRGTAAPAAESEGVRLHLSSATATGYKGVSRKNSRFAANTHSGCRKIHLGTFDTAVEAALIYARHVAAQPPARDAKGTAAAAAANAYEIDGRASDGGGAALTSESEMQDSDDTDVSAGSWQSCGSDTGQPVRLGRKGARQRRGKSRAGADANGDTSEDEEVEYFRKYKPKPTSRATRKLNRDCAGIIKELKGPFKQALKDTRQPANSLDVQPGADFTSYDGFRSCINDVLAEMAEAAPRTATQICRPRSQICACECAT